MDDDNQIKNYIEKFKKGETPRFDKAFAVQDKVNVSKYANGYSLKLRVSDKSQVIDLKYWGDQDKEAIEALFDSLNIGDVVLVKKAIVAFYNNRYEIYTNEPIEKAQEGYYLGDFIPSLEEERINELYNAVMQRLSEIKDEDCKEIRDVVLQNQNLMEMFKRIPSSVSGYHGSYVGGLLEHTHNVMMIAMHHAKLFNLEERWTDILCLAAFLHDFGKKDEYDQFLFKRKDKYKERNIFHPLLTHDFIRDIAKDVTEDFLFDLLSVADSAHGRKEYGTLVVPKTLAQRIMHMADLTDTNCNIGEDAAVR